ncbi:MAG: phosphoenolpyruvate--protein phosphotransferase, partial [Oscillospiraceae bacterium]|nr:phosphoenolpyruvate--protein phosphotransferase [Oscillospiraceae bacterium]
MITIQGKGVSSGIGIGPLYFYRRPTGEVKRYTPENSEAELQRFHKAQAVAMEQLGALAEKARQEAGDEAALLF